MSAKEVKKEGSNSKVENKNERIVELKENTGFLHRSVPNERTVEGSPQFFGNGRFEGVNYFISGWSNRSEKGNVYIQLSFRPEDVEIEDWKSEKERFSEEFEVEKTEMEKEEESERKFILVNFSGNLHRTAEVHRDFFGNQRINNKIISLDAKMIMVKNKSVLKLGLSKGMTKADRNNLVDSFI